MSRLYNKAEMQPGRPQTLVNLAMEKDATYFILFSLPRTAIRGDVIELFQQPPSWYRPQGPSEETRPKTE